MSAEQEPLPPDIAELLRREREADGPSSEARARIQKRVIASLGSGVAVATLAKSAATGKVAIAGGVASKLTLVIVACAIGTAAIGVGAYAVAHRRAAPSAPAIAKVAPRPTPVQPAIVPPPAEAPTPPPVKTTAPRVVTRHDSERADLRAERALLAAAHDALAASDSTLALAALDRHAHRFPSGQLAEERECLRIRALGEAGDTAGAERAAAAFMQRFPHGLFQAASCASRDGTR